MAPVVPPVPTPICVTASAGGGGVVGTNDFWPHSFHATPIGSMLKSHIQGGARCPCAPPRSAAYGGVLCKGDQKSVAPPSRMEPVAYLEIRQGGGGEFAERGGDETQ